MKKILVIESSPRGENSISRQVSAAIIQRLSEKYPQSTVVREDLTENLPTHLNLMQINGESLSLSDKYIDQIKNSDVIVIGYPVWNFLIPSSLKAWLDQIVRVGKTFQYKNSIPEGLLKDKIVFLAIARGGIYPEEFSVGEKGLYDYSIPYMKSILSYIGITNVAAIKAEGLAIPGIKESALEKALASINIDHV